MGRHKDRNDQGNNTSSNNQQLPSECKLDAKAVYSIVVKPSPNEEKQYAEEKDSRSQQLAVARRLNWITGVASAAAIASLVFLYISLQNTKDHVRTGQRAYVTAEDFKLTSPLTEHSPLRVEFEVKNTGQTPAGEVVVTPIVYIAVDPPEQINYEFEPARRDLGASQSAQMSAGRLAPWSAEEAKEVIQEDWTVDSTNKVLPTTHRHFYVVGRITYNDVFGGKGETEFCAVYMPPSLQGASGKQFSSCRTHNHIR